MCRSIPGQVVEIVDPAHRVARVEVGGQARLANLALFEPHEIAVGDWVLLQAGLVVERLTAEEASELLKLLDEINRFYEEEETP